MSIELRKTCPHGFWKAGTHTDQAGNRCDYKIGETE